MRNITIPDPENVPTISPAKKKVPPGVQYKRQRFCIDYQKLKHTTSSGSWK